MRFDAMTLLFAGKLCYMGRCEQVVSTATGKFKYFIRYESSDITPTVIAVILFHLFAI